MSLFRDQPGFCCVCGARDVYPFKANRPVICGRSCWDEFWHRNALYIMGKEYHPDTSSSPVKEPSGSTSVMEER